MPFRLKKGFRGTLYFWMGVTMDHSRIGTKKFSVISNLFHAYILKFKGLFQNKQTNNKE